MVGPTGKGLFRGEASSSVFSEPFIDYDFQPNQLPSFLQRIQNTGDDRSFVIVSAVVVEKYLDDLLQAIAPGYRKLAERRELTFSLKIDLLRALRLIPPHIVQAADLLRQVRNEFAHNIERDQLEQVETGLRTALAQRVRELYGDQPPYSTSAREMFKALTFVALAGFQAYRPNLSILREKLEQGSLAGQLKDECHKRFISGIETTKDQGALKIEEREGWRATYYDRGIVSIEPTDPDGPPLTVDLSKLNWKPSGQD